jgi:sulfhydrogenase subunit gamma (sulfur reductase)
MATEVATKSIYLPEPATIVKVEQMTQTEKLFELKLNNGRELGHKPGQFIELSIMGMGEAPISVSSSPTKKGGFELVVRKAGRVTGALHRLTAGSQVGIRGPFGTNFPADDLKGKDILFVGGGIGLVPLRSFINYVLDNRKNYGRVIILFGARNPAERLFPDELAEWAKRDDVEFFETVDRADESWTGNVGVITTLFPKVEIDPLSTVCAIVGPPVMYKFVIIELRQKKIPYENIFLSLERRMKCGVGKCGHCQIQDLYVCKDGPVFRFSDIHEYKEAI